MEVLRLEVFRAAIRRILAGDVDAPKVVIGQGQSGKHGFDTVVDELDDAARVVQLDLPSLSLGHAGHGKQRVPAHGEADGTGPETVVDVIFVNLPLFLQGANRKDRIEPVAQLRDVIDIPIEHPRQPTRSARK